MTLRAMLTLLADQPPARQRLALTALLARDGAEPPAGEGLEDFTRRAAAAFAKDMAPVRNAIVAALQAGDVDALKGLRALLPHLLKQVNDQPALADLLAHQLGKEILQGLTEAKP